MNAGTLRISTELDTKSFDAQIKDVEYEISSLENTLSRKKELKLTSPEVIELESKLEKAKNKLIQLNSKSKETKNNFKEVAQSSSGIGNALNTAVGKMAKLGLAVFGIRSAYSAIRNAMETISQYDDKMATDLEYIQFALAMSIKPIIDIIIKLVYQLLALLNQISMKIFNYNLFANGSADAFKKAKKNASGLNKELKKMQTTKFDEMSILGKDTASSGGAGGNTPSFDLSKMNFNIDDFSGLFNDLAKKIDEFLVKIKKNIVKVLLDLGFSKDFIAFWGMMFDGIRMEIEGFLKFVGGILDIIIGFVSGNSEQVKKGVKNLLDGLLLFLQGFITKTLGNLGALGTLIIQAFGGIFNAVKDACTKVFGSMWNGLTNGAKNSFVGIKNVFSGLANFFKNIFTSAWEKVKNVFSTGGKIFDGIKDGIEKVFKTIVNKLIDGINRVVSIPFKKINSMMNKIHDVNILGVKPFSGLWKIDPISIPNIPKLATGGIVNMPGKGTFVGSAVAGERGAEGVIPLTDNQAMETLGEAIGRYITINANITNSMNGKVLSRELQRINNSNNFAMNR